MIRVAIVALVLAVAGQVALALALAGDRGTVVLRVDRPVAKPGGKVKVRIENRSASGISYGNPFTLQRRESGSWVDLPSQGPWFAVRHGLYPGGVGDWQAVRIARRDPPGTYRVQKVITSGEGSSKAARRFPVRVNFRVEARG